LKDLKFALPGVLVTPRALRRHGGALRTIIICFFFSFFCVFSVGLCKLIYHMKGTEKNNTEKKLYSVKFLGTAKELKSRRVWGFVFGVVFP
jgi:hypothetical protein